MKDWTASKDGSSNSSDEYLKIVNEVARIIRESAHLLIAGNTRGVARTIVSQLAHVYKLSPPEPANPVDVEMENCEHSYQDVPVCVHCGRQL